MGWEDDPFTGIFTRFGALAPEVAGPRMAMFSGAVAPLGPRTAEIGVGGVGWDTEAARGAALGEAVERLQAYRLPGDCPIHASFEDWPLDDPAVEPEAWVLFHEEQYGLPGFPFGRFTRQQRCQWTRFRRFPDGSAAWVPDDMAYLYSSVGNILCPSISTGLSAGRSGQPVLLRGVQEVIERDAVMGAWWETYRLERYDDREVLAQLRGDLVDQVFRPNLTLGFYRVHSPFSSHVTIVTVEGEATSGYCFAAGSACRETRARSWEKALLEAMQSLRYVDYLRTTTGASREGVDRLDGFAAHASYYSRHQERLSQTAFGKAVPPTQADVDVVENLEVLGSRLGPGLPVLFRSMVPPAIAAEFGDWVVLRVVIPGLQPLHGHAAFAHLGGPLWAPRGLADFRAHPPHPFA